MLRKRKGAGSSGEKTSEDLEKMRTVQVGSAELGSLLGKGILCHDQQGEKEWNKSLKGCTGVRVGKRGVITKVGSAEMRKRSRQKTWGGYMTEGVLRLV